MKRKKRRSQKEIVHRMQIDLPQRGQNKNQEEKEKQRYRRKIRNLSRQRPGLQLLRHLQRNIKSAHQVLVIPLQIPSLRRFVLFRRRQCVLRKIESAKIRLHQQMEIVDPRNVLSVRELIAPGIQSLRPVPCL